MIKELGTLAFILFLVAALMGILAKKGKVSLKWHQLLVAAAIIVTVAHILYAYGIF